VSSRQYPDRPIVGVGAVIVRDGRVVLIKRKYEPLKGRWSLPGGGVEVGETLVDAVAREMLEETGLRVAVGPVIEVFDRITRDEAHRVRYHYVLVDYLCWPVAGELQPGSDVDDARLVDPGELAPFDLAPPTAAVIERGVRLAREAPRPVR
jgi:8-oxo-dGTP diphosphatase